VTQSSAQWRWAAKKAGLYPRDEEGDERALRIDELVDTVNELGAKVPQDKDVEAKRAKRAAFVAEVLPKYLNFFTAKLSAGPSGLFFERITLADLVLFSTLYSIKKGQWDFIEPSVLDAWPAIGRFYDAVLAHELVQRHGLCQLG
jgi:glutathione S-transferase